jgi:probable HAF family extracellular repeat protein
MGGAFNNLGQVAVSYSLDLAPSQSFFWDEGNITPIVNLGGNDNLTTVKGMNDLGQVIGSLNTANNETHAFRWQAGEMKDLGTLGGNYSSPFAINEAGQIIGDSTTANGKSHGFFWDNGVMRDLGDLGGGASTLARKINAKGQVFGCSTTASRESHAFVWTSGVMRDTGISNCYLYFDESNSYRYDPFSFNDRGQVIFTHPNNSSFYDGQRTYSNQDIEDLLGENSGWDITKITGLNNKGQIVGTGLFNGQQSAFVMTPNGEPVPEPSTIIGSVLAIGSLGSAAYRRRKAR